MATMATEMSILTVKQRVVARKHIRVKVYLNRHQTLNEEPYSRSHVENTSSRSFTKVKQHWAWLVPERVTSTQVQQVP